MTSPTAPPPASPSAPAGRRVAVPLALGVAVLTAVLVAVAGGTHRVLAGNSGPRVEVALVLGVLIVAGLVGLAGRRADLTVALAAVGALAAVAGSGLGRLRGDEWLEGSGGGDVVRSSARSWPLVAIGVGLVLGAVVAALMRPTSRPPRVVAALAGLATHAAGSVLLAALLGDVVVGQWIEGRPRRRRGRLVRPRPGVDAAAPSSPGALWAEAAVEEAEAVGAFDDLAARLEALGGPADLVARARRAATDEVRHARLCRHLAGEPAGPAARPTVAGAGAGAGPGSVARAGRPHRARRVELVRLAVESYVDGVVGEGMAAGRLERGAATAPGRAGVLRSIARDERGHAALGGDVVRWAAAEAPVLVPLAVRASARRLPETGVLPAGHAAVADADLRAAGLVDRAGATAVWVAERQAALDALDDLVAPPSGR